MSYEKGQLTIAETRSVREVEDFIENLISNEQFRSDLEADPAGFLRKELGIELTDDLVPSRKDGQPFRLPPPHRIDAVYRAMKENSMLDNPNHLFAALKVVHPAFPLVADTEGDGAR